MAQILFGLMDDEYLLKVPYNLAFSEVEQVQSQSAPNSQSLGYSSLR